MADAAGRRRRVAGSGHSGAVVLRRPAGGAEDFSAAVERHLNRPGWRLFAIRVLIVENDAFNMKLLRDLLGVLGHAVLEAADGPEAIALARRHQPDLVFVAADPRAGSALTLTRRLRAEPALAQIPVIVLTDPIGGAAAEPPGDGEFDGSVPKPISLTLFLEVLERLLSDPAN